MTALFPDSSLSLYNTLSRQKEPFVPLTPGKVNMYVCGMTVYDYCHLGHARVLVVFDVVYRWLQSLGYDVTYVRNITDIDDKIIRRAAENQETIGALTQRFIDAMNEDAQALGVLRPTHEPRATDQVSIAGMFDLIKQLMARGMAYAAPNGDVYYAVREFPGYGKLSGKSLDDLRAGERVDVDPNKRDPLDFVLWKAAKADEPAQAKWASPWGEGRPGWHIECSAMSCTHLGPHFDIHGGGADLQFPHHENEIAQSEGAHGQRYVNYWMHNGFVRVVNHAGDEEKMSKSLGNFFTIRDVLQRYDSEVVRFFILRAHYRSPLNYSDAHLEDARHALGRLYTALKNVPPSGGAWASQHPAAQAFAQAMNDDFGTPEAVAVLFELANDINKTQSPQLSDLLLGLAGTLGLLQRDPVAFLQAAAGDDGLDVAQVETLIAARRAARAAKDFAESDRIRAQLTAMGVVLEDGPQGTTWRRA